jgi:glutamate-5-semialdehyde dehydrogenase
MNEDIVKLAIAASKAARQVARLNSNQKNEILLDMADNILKNRELILKANEIDIKSGKEKNLSDAMLDRLLLTEGRINSMANALKDVVQLPDPVGKKSDMRIRPNQLQVEMMSIPLGVIAIIYEARPNVTSDAAGLCLKSGNAVILRGGSEAFNSSKAIVEAMHAGLEKYGIDKAAITFVPTTDRQVMVELLKLDQYIDLVIPRGGEGLIRFVSENSRIPVIKHYKGVCHLYVDKDADFEMAVRLLLDGKTSRPGVCNALETLLVHKDIASRFLPMAGKALSEKGVEIHGCSKTKAILPDALLASEEDYDTEYLALKISAKVVDDYEEAINHIAIHGSNHTDVIVTNNLRTSQQFIRDVNSSSVMVNASSRFADGGEMGLGAEIGISTTKLHAYGPMGLEALTTRKFVVIGDGQTRHKVS